MLQKLLVINLVLKRNVNINVQVMNKKMIRSYEVNTTLRTHVMDRTKTYKRAMRFYALLTVSFFVVGIFFSELYNHKRTIIKKVMTEDGVDIVITVHDALNELKDTLATVKTFTPQPYHVYIVNDRSKEPTLSWLKSINTAHTSVYHLTKPNVGYTHAVNLGISKGRQPYVLILNSDTILPHNWLNNMMRCMKSVPGCSIVGPLSNAGSYQSVPAIKEKVLGPDGKTTMQWSNNILPKGWTHEGMSSAVNKLSDRVYPTVPLLNGFCMMAKREVFRKVGLFDAEKFALGYGEENDFMLRAGKLGVTAAVDDSTYVYHHKTRSFSNEEKVQQSKKGTEALIRLHLKSTVKEKSHEFDKKMKQLDPLRDRLRFSIQFPELFHGPSLSILFLLPSSSPGGGSTSVVREAQEMKRTGLTVRIALWDKSFPVFISVYPEAHDMFVPWPKKSDKNVESIKNLVKYGALFDIVISTVWVSVDMMYEIYKLSPNVLPAYYIQDYEPDFFSVEQEKDRRRSSESYSKAAKMGSVMYAKSSWLTEKLLNAHNVHVDVVPAAIEDMDCQSAIPQHKPKSPVRIVAMLRPATPRRDAKKTYLFLRSIKLVLGPKLEVITFGCKAGELLEMEKMLKPSLNDKNIFEYTHMGVLNRSEISDLYQDTDIFLDLSVWQAYGRSAAEAMTCGNTAIITSAGGASEFVKHEYNGFLVDPTDYNNVLSVVVDLVESRERLLLIQQRARAVREDLRLRPAVLARLMLFKTKMAERLSRHVTRME